jgi:hypothetical protein
MKQHFLFILLAAAAFVNMASPIFDYSRKGIINRIASMMLLLAAYFSIFSQWYIKGESSIKASDFLNEFLVSMDIFP